MRPGLGRPWLVGATVVAVVAGSAAGAYLVLRPGVETVAVFPPITPTETGTADPAIRIPEGFLESEAVSKRPLHQPEVRWVRTDEPSLPPLLSPCGGTPDDAAGRVAGRQLALVAPTRRPAGAPQRVRAQR
jgi:hypothetical protein